MSRTKRTVLTVFIGSPSDLHEERKKAHEIIQRLNHSLGRNLGITVDLRGWEDTRPGWARPQERINDDVRQSDIFVGLVWKRWGTPTGAYTSGFEEEFMLAKELRRSEQLEDIWLFFKNVPEDMLRDPGDQLRQVLEFRDQVEARREVLYESFDSVADWSVKFHDYLINYLTQEIGTGELAQAGAAPSSEEGSAEEYTDENDLLHSLDAISDAVREDSLLGVENLQAARSYLASLAILYLSRPDTQLIGIHENQLLYFFRRQVQFLREEEAYVLRNLAADTGQLNVGWFWISSTLDGLALQLISLCSSDDLEEVKKGTLRLIELLGVEVEFDYIKWIVDHSSDSVAEHALAAYGQCASSSGFERLKELLNYRSPDVAEAAWRAALAILVRHDPDRAIEWFRDSTQSRKSRNIDILEPVWSSVPSQKLETLLEDEDPIVRHKTFEAVKTELSTEMLRRFTSDSSEWLRAAAYMELAGRDTELDEQEMEERIKEAEEDTLTLLTPEVMNLRNPPQVYRVEDIRLKHYKTWPYERLQEDNEWYSEHLHEKYEALGDSYFEEFKGTLRSDLTERFERLKRRAYPEELREHPALLEEFRHQHSRVDEFISDRLRKAAYTALSNYAEPDDVRFARSFLSSPDSELFTEDLARASYRILEKYGAADDIEMLRSFLRSNLNNPRSEIKRDAARLILHLAPIRFHENATYLLDLDDADVTRGVLQYSLNNNQALSSEELIGLLFNSAQRIRLDALALMVHTFSREELETLLDDYPSLRGRYYYNVVSWLDRILYAPTGLREVYTAELKQRLRNADS
jgi:hypothetical protein